jgi:hypothetical protein
VRRYGPGLVVAGTSLQDNWVSKTAEQVPLILIKEATAPREASTLSKHDRADVDRVGAEFLYEFAARRLLRRLSGFDAPTGRIPVGTVDRVWIEEEKQSLLVIEQQHPSRAAIGHGNPSCQEEIHLEPIGA